LKTLAFVSPSTSFAAPTIILRALLGSNDLDRFRSIGNVELERPAPEDEAFADLAKILCPWGTWF
jgi:hypothetical protein